MKSCIKMTLKGNLIFFYLPLQTPRLIDIFLLIVWKEITVSDIFLNYLRQSILSIYLTNLLIP